jgi:hypothetical protein
MNTLPQPLRGTTTALAAAALVAAALAACQASDGSSGTSVVDDAALTAYLQAIADQVAGDSSVRVVVYDADFAQAFALPGDEIALTRGMLAFIHSEAEIACVLGHEIAHHRLGHVSEFFASGASPAIDASHPLARGWPGSQEQAADDLGLSLCAAAGYDPLSAPHLLLRAARWDSEQSLDDLLGDEELPPMVDRTHRALDTIGDGDLDGGSMGFREYISIRESVADASLAPDASSQGEARPYFSEFVRFLEDPRGWAEEEFEQFQEDARDSTFEWRDQECERDGVTVIPSNHLDAFGHCWSGCRAHEICPQCGNPGIFYEIARELGYGGPEHDSFWEDTRNQEVGINRSWMDGSCADICGDAIESGNLVLTAPRRRWWVCRDRELLPEGEQPLPGEGYSDYGALGSPDIFGDPHLVTMDGLRYDFHGVGEFVAMESTADDLVVQVRFAEVAALHASKTTAVAANVNGDRVGAYLGAGGFVVRINGDTVTPNGSWVPLPNGGRVQVDDDQVVFEWLDDTRLWVYYWGNVLDISMTLPSQREAKLAGLLGNADRDPSNEYITREGVPVDVPEAHGDARKEALYSEFGESWRIDASESLFDYEPGESSDGFQDRAFPSADQSIDDLDATTRSAARENCVALGVTESPWLEDCIFDIGFTGDVSWARSARNAADPNSLTSNDMYEAQSEVDGEGVYLLERFFGRAGDEHFFRYAETMSSLDLANWQVIAPSGARLFSHCVYACNQPGAYVLPESGTYTSQLVADPGNSGVLRVARNVVPQPQVFDVGDANFVALESLGPGAGSISVPGDEDVYRIDGLAGTTLSLSVEEIDRRIFFGHWKLTDPNGAVVFDDILPTAGATPRSEDLVLDGTYLLTVHGGSRWPSDLGDFGHGTYRMLLQVGPTS